MEQMINFREYIPYINIPFIAEIKYGTRTVISTPVGYRFTDCNHPMENANCSSFDIISWKYKDDQYMQELYFIKNEWTRKQEADDILSAIQGLTLIEKVKLKVTRLLNI